MKRTNIYPIKRLFILDEMAVIAAFLLALAIRYKSSFWRWSDMHDGLYISFLMVLAFLQALVFAVYDSRRTPIFELDPVDNFMLVLKDKVMLIALALMYLFASHKAQLASRYVLAATFVFLVIFDFIARIVAKKIYRKRHPWDGESSTLEICEPYPDGQKVVERVREGGYSEVLIHDAYEFGKNSLAVTKEAEDRKARVDSILEACDKAGIRAFIGLDAGDYRVRSGIVTSVNGYASIPAYVRKEKFDLFGVKYSIARTEEAVYHVIGHIKDLKGKYICFSNVHTSVMAKEDAAYRDVLNGAAFVFPDGKPIAVLQQKNGLIGADRVAGPDFMEHMFRDTQDGKIGHFFYGASQETIDALRDNLLKKYPGINIKGMYSPPFRTLTEEEDRADIDMINESGADIVWIGLGAPRQEKWMNAHKDRVNGVMMGVGAGFDFHAGTIKRAPYWIQKIGLEWLYRLFQDPGRLFKRYFVTNGKFFWYLLFEGANRKKDS